MEHRWGERRSVNQPVRLTAGGRLVVLGRLQDVSHSGAFIVTCARINPLMLVEVELGHGSPGGGRGGCRIPAFVVRNAADGVGVEWCEYAPAGIEVLFAVSAGTLPSRSAASCGDC